MRFETPVRIDDLFAFTRAQNLFPKVYWEHPHDGVRACFGEAVSFDALPVFDEEVGPRFYGGQDFMIRKEHTWDGFPKERFFLPLIEIEMRGKIAVLCVNRCKKKIKAELQEEKQGCIGKAIRSEFAPPLFQWEDGVNRVLQGIKLGDFSKVVLARRLTLSQENPVCPYALLSAMKSKTRFAFQFSPEKTFIGMSPETLFRREGNKVESAAIAGTRPRGKTAKEDKRLEDKLLNSPKEKREFEVVQEMIKDALSPLCEQIDAYRKTVLKTTSVQHLAAFFSAELKEGVRDDALIEALHPTPALGGMPRAQALAEIQKREPFDRGWYGAPVGWTSSQAAHFLVGIRSALIDKAHVHLF
ncbi:MAG: isochorismate synthase, partial [Chlamydiia bacterium]|nr:isochorismate synthase [Chlamydiia bacterium]